MHLLLQGNSPKESYGSNDIVPKSHKRTIPLTKEPSLNKPGRQNGIGTKVSLNNSSACMRNHTLLDLGLGGNNGRIFQDCFRLRSSRNSNLMNNASQMTLNHRQFKTSSSLSERCLTEISSGLRLHLDTFEQNGSKPLFLNVKWRLLASLQALFLKVKKGVRLQRKGKCTCQCIYP
ncbi:hypothetical protein Tco_0121567 [Tanacetum coccineum]